MGIPVVSNSAGQFGISNFVVSTNPSAGNYTSIANAITMCAAAGGGTIYVQPGTYAGNLTMPASNISITAASSSGEVIITGNNTMTATGTAVFSGIQFIAGAGNAWTIGNGGASTTSVSFQSCIINGAANGIVCSSVSGVNLLDITGSTVSGGTGNAVQFANGTFTASENTFSSASSDCIVMGIAGDFSGINNNILALSGNSVDITSASANWISNFNQYTASGAGFHYTAAGAVISVDEGYNCGAGSGFFADTTGPAGTFKYAFLVLAGSALGINPALISSVYPQAGVSASGSVSTLTGNSGGALSPTAGNINIVGTGTVSVAGAGSTLTITGGPTFTWDAIIASQPMVVNTGYIVTANAVTLSLPATASVGQQVGVVLSSGVSWQITQAIGQSIQVGSAFSTTGTSGSLSSNSVGDGIILVCSVANTSWVAVPAPQGNLTIM